MLNKYLYITLNIFSIIALISSCAGNLPNKPTLLDNPVISSNVESKYRIRGTAQFTPSPNHLNHINHSSDSGIYNTKATLSEVGTKATVSILYPPDYVTSALRNVTVATGLTDASGVFTVNPLSTFNPVIGDIFVLEAAKRIGAAGNAVITVRTYIKWNGHSWDSMTTPDLYINSKTTALAIIDSYDNNISASETIGTIDVSTDVSIPGNIGSSPIKVTAATISEVTAYVDNLLSQSVDPVRNISYFL